MPMSAFFSICRARDYADPGRVPGGFELFRPVLAFEGVGIITAL